jgi:MoaA/NifB/PqqE/SkfB family radical SAM enzyme
MLHKIINEEKKTIVVYLENSCNNNCISCMLLNVRAKLKAISFASYKNIIDSAKKNKKFNRLTLSGAEITKLDNLPLLIRYAKNSSLFNHIQLQSNGRNFSNLNYCKKIISAGANEFFISVLGDTTIVHDCLTRTKGSFDQTMHGLRNLNKLKTNLIPNTVITNFNYKSLPRIVELMSAFNSVKKIHFWNYVPMQESDKYNLMANIKLVQPYLLQAIKKSISADILPIVKHYPSCLLRKFYGYSIKSYETVIIDDLFWKELAKNRWQCVYYNICRYGKSENRCDGLSAAYIERYGYEERILKPIHGRKS